MQATFGNRRVLLSEAELEPLLPACPICGSRESRTKLMLQPEPEVTLLLCAQCQAGYASRMPTNAALDAYYSDYYAHAKYGNDERAIHFAHPERLARHLLAGFGLPRRNTVTIVDFGGGDGTISVLLAELLVQAGAGQVDISLIDYEVRPRVPTSDRIRVTRVASAPDLPTAAFDLVIASASLEHVPALRATLQALLAALRSGGRFYARTPVVASMIRLAARFGISIDFGYPAHVYDVGERFWSHLPERLDFAKNFRIIASRPALVESTFDTAPLRTMAAYTLKAPWRLLGESYGLVGGWEVILERTA